MAKKRYWTTAELEVLAEYWPKGGVRTCVSYLPGRDPCAIASKAQKLGLFVAGYKRPERVNWSPFLDKQVKAAYSDPSTGAVKSAAGRLDIPYGTFKARARMIGCVYRYYNRPWEEAEDALVRQYLEKGLAWTQRKLKIAGFQRSQAAISSRRYKLGCVKDDDPDLLSASQLAQLCGLDPKTVLRWIEKGWLKAKRGASLCVPDPKPDYFWRIRVANFRAFIRDYPSAIDLRKVDQPWFLDVILGPPNVNATDRRAGGAP